MLTSRFAGVGWCDVTKNGTVVGINKSNQIVLFPRQVVTDAPEQLLYLRADNSGPGDLLAVVGQGHSKGDCHLFAGGKWQKLGFCGGQNCVEIVGVLNGWIVFAQFAADKYKTFSIDLSGELISIANHVIPWTSQGFLDVTDDRLKFTDNARRIGDVVLPNKVGDYLVGQYKSDPPRMVLSDRDGKVLKLLTTSNCDEPRGATVGDQIVTCSRSGNQDAVVVAGRFSEFQDFVNVPIPDPEPDPEPTMTPQNIIDIMVNAGKTIDSRFPGLRSSNNEAWMAKAAYLASLSHAGIGRKARSAGARVSPDTMGYQEGSTSNFYAVSIIRDNPPTNEWRDRPLDYGLISGQLWIKAEPVDVGDVVTPPPPPPPPPNDEVASLKRRIENIESWIRSF